jgi:hypothetical protein
MTKQERMTLGRRRAYLQKCIAAIELLEQHETDTSIRYRVFEKHIAPVIRVSYTQFNNMLNEKNPQRELEEINKKLSNEKKNI